MKFILGEKIGMSQIWKDDKIVPVTLIKSGPIIVTQIRNKDKDGYEAIQVGFGEKKSKNINKAQRGHFKNLGNFRYLREFRIKKNGDEANLKVGDIFKTDQFSEGDKVEVDGLTKGRGFQGGVKRHGFKGGPKTHGQKNRLRAPGSIGATAPQRVMPNRKMAGRMGLENMKIINLKIAGVDVEKNILMINGSVSGRKGTLLKIYAK